MIQNDNQLLLLVAIENPGAILQDWFEGFMEGSSKIQVEDVVKAQEALADSSNTS